MRRGETEEAKNKERKEEEQEEDIEDNRGEKKLKKRMWRGKERKRTYTITEKGRVKEGKS